MQKTSPDHTNKMNRCVRFSLDAKTTSALTEFISRKIPFSVLPLDVKNLIRNQMNLKRKERCGDIDITMKKKMRRHVLMMESAFEFKRRAESVLRDNKSVLQEFKSLLTNIGDKNTPVSETEKRIRGILVDYPELYIQCTKTAVIRWEEKNKTTGKEERKRRKRFRPYEEQASMMEDVRYNYDRQVGLLRSTAEIIFNISRGSKEHVLSSIHLKCIKEMYGKRGDDILEQIRTKPEISLLLIYDRFCRRLDEVKDDKTAIDKDLKKALQKLKFCN